MELLTTGHPRHPALDMALTGTLLGAVARGDAPDTIRIFRPGPTLAFGRMDRARAGFAEACRVAAGHGRAPLLRWGGGHAAAYDFDCVLIEIVRGQEHIVGGLEQRFLDLAALVQEAVGGLGVSLELGELPGEYCPGRFSLHLPGGPKAAGIAQRVIRGASLTTATIVVRGGEALRAVIADVYAALDLPVDISAAGALADRHPGLTVEAVMAAAVERARRRYAVTPVQLSAELVAQAARTIADVQAPAHRTSINPGRSAIGS